MLIIGIIFCFLSLTTQVHAESLNDKVFSIVNPTTKAQIITNKKGNVLLSNIDPEFESIEIVYDVLSNEQAFLLKNYKGEYSVEATEGVYEKAPSSRVVFYDLSGTEVGFECEAFLNAGSIGSKILCSCIDKLIVFDTLTKEKRDYTPRGFVAYGNVVMLYDSSYYDVKGIVILDRNLNEINRYEDYMYSESYDDIKIGDISYKRIRKLIDSNKRKYTFNMLNENGDKIFPKDFENEIEFDNNIEKLLFGNVVFQYDFVNQNFISSPSIISDEEREKIVNDTAYAKILQQGNKLYNDFLYFDENTKKIESTIDASLWSHVYKWTSGDKILYCATYEGGTEIATWSTADGTIEEDGTVWYSYNIYDSEANLLFENVAEWDLSTKLKDYGYLGIRNVIYDFDMNKLAEYNEDDMFEIYVIKDKTYFVDNYKRLKRHFRERKYNLIDVYDDKFNLLFSNLEDFVYLEKNNLIAMTDKDSTKLYDEKFRILKDLNTKICISNNYTDKYCVFTNTSLDRYGIVDRHGNICVSGMKEISHLADDYFVYQNGFKYGIMDYNGNEII